MLLAALAYVLIKRMRALALQGTELASAQTDTLPSVAIFAQAMRALGDT